MLNNNRMALLTISTLLSAVSFADEVEVANTDSKVLPAVTLIPTAIYPEQDTLPRRRSYYLADATTFSDNWPSGAILFDFHDNSLLARASKLRNLSLLTLATHRHARVYLGVNDDGLVGLHFNASLRERDERDERYLELARMPYLADDKPDHDQTVKRQKSTPVESSE